LPVWGPENLQKVEKSSIFGFLGGQNRVLWATPLQPLFRENFEGIFVISILASGPPGWPKPGKSDIFDDFDDFRHFFDDFRVFGGSKPGGQKGGVGGSIFVTFGGRFPVNWGRLRKLEAQGKK